MRHLLVLILLLAGLGCAAPAAVPRHAVPAMQGMAAHGGCHDEGCAVHDPCLGCAVAPADHAPLGDRPRPAMLAYHSSLAGHPSGYRTGFDPPPPRRAS